MHAWRISPFQYRAAVVRGLSPVFSASALRADGSSASIHQALAEAQHAAYVAALRKLVPVVHELPPAEGCADSCFIEDTAIVVGGTALITSPGAPSRRGETAGVAAALAGLGLRIVHAPAGCALDGGDVLFTGRELFVGLSNRTDRGGVAAVRAAFPGLSVTPLTLPGGRFDGNVRDRAGRKARSAARAAGDAAAAARRPAAPPSAAAPAAAAPVRGASPGRAPPAPARPHVHAPGGACCGGDAQGALLPAPPFHALHLKSLMSLVAPDVIAVAGGDEGLALAEQLQARQKADPRRRPLQFIILPDAPAANALYANGRLLARAAKDFPQSAELLRAISGGGEAHVEVEVSELAKADGALTCCALLIH